MRLRYTRRPSQDRAPESLPLPRQTCQTAIKPSQLLSTYDGPLQAYAMIDDVVAKGASEFRQPLAPVFYNVGDEDGIDTGADSEPITLQSRSLQSLLFGQRIDTLDAISAAAHGKRVVILQESHFDQRHRAFASSELRLRKESSRTWVLRAFNNCTQSCPQNKSMRLICN